jgi:hypothetical protein
MGKEIENRDGKKQGRQKRGTTKTGTTKNRVGKKRPEAAGGRTFFAHPLFYRNSGD